MRLVLSFLLLLLTSICLAQDDFDYANNLAENGYFDLAKEILQRMQKSAKTEDVKIQVKYGFIKVELNQITREQNPKKKVEFIDSLTGKMRDFIKSHDGHSRTLDAYNNLIEVYQYKGTILVQLNDPKDAETTFKDTLKICEDQIQKYATVTSIENARARYNFIVTLFHIINLLKTDSSRISELQTNLENLKRFFETFCWDYGSLGMTYEAFIYVGRAQQAAAELYTRSRDIAKAKENFLDAINNINTAYDILINSPNRNDPDIRYIALEAAYYLILARQAYADSLKYVNEPFKDELAKAIRLADDVLQNYPEALAEDEGVKILTQKARIYFLTGDTENAKATVEKIEKINTHEAKVGVFKLKQEFSSSLTFMEAFDVAEKTFWTGNFITAISRFKDIMKLARTKDEQLKIPECWLIIGRAYYYSKRYFEAVEVLTKALQIAGVKSKISSEIAEFKYLSLEQIVSLTNSPDDKRNFEEFSTFMIKNNLGKGLFKRNQAVKCTIEKKYQDAMKIWEELFQDESIELKFRQEALLEIGYSLFMLAKSAEEQGQKETATNLYDQAVSRFKGHIGFINKHSIPEKDVLREIGNSYKFLCLISLNQGKITDVMNSSEQYLTQFKVHAPEHLISILKLRVSAFIKSGDVAKAEAEFKALQQKHLQTKVGLTDYQYSAAELTEAFKEKSEELKDSDPEKSKLYQRKSNYYFALYLRLNPNLANQFNNIIVQADLTFNDAMDESKVEQRRLLFNEALEFYRELIAKYEKQIQDHPDKYLSEKINWKMALCYLGLDNYDEAEKKLDQLERLKDDPEILETRGDIRLAKAKKNNDKTLMGNALSYYAQVTDRLRRDKKEIYYRNLYKYAKGLYDMGEYDQLNNWLGIIEEKSPGYDNDKWGYKSKFEQLKKDLNERVVHKR